MTTARRSHKRSKELPKNARIVKRQLPRPVPPPRLSADPKIVYLNANSPFVSVVKRVRKALEVFKDQAKINLASNRRQNRSSRGRQPQFNPPSSSKPHNDQKKYVAIKASGRAIEKALALGLYFQGQKDTAIEIRTGTVECTDDVVADQSNVTFADLMKTKLKMDDKIQSTNKSKEREEGAMDVDTEIPEDVDEEDDFAEIDDVFPSRTRNTSVIEIIVRNKVPE